MLLTQPKITLTVDGAVVEGEFVHLQPNDIRVRLRKPFDDGQTAGLHRPGCACANLLMTDRQLVYTDPTLPCPTVNFVQKRAR